MNTTSNAIFRKFIAIALILLSILTLPLTANADELSDKINQKEEIDSELGNIENEIGNTQNNLDNIESDIENLEQAQKFQESTKKQIIESLESLKKDILELDGQIIVLEKEFSEKEALFIERAKTMYQYSDYNWIDLFFESDNIFDFLDKISVYRKMLKSDRDLMNELTSVRNTLAYKKELQTTIFANKEALLEETQNAINAIKNDIEIIQSDYQNLTEVLNQLAERENELIQNSDELQEDIDYLENKKNNNASSANPSESGFIFPLESYVYLSSPFGYRTHPITGQQYSFHTGIDLAAYGGTPIYAAADGRVTVAVPVDNGGYGLWIEIEHSNGMKTRYAHCNEIYVKVGDTVKQGQKIAEVGTSGSSTGNHLHFEVLVSGSQKNPVNYIIIP